MSQCRHVLQQRPIHAQPRINLIKPLPFSRSIRPLKSFQRSFEICATPSEASNQSPRPSTTPWLPLDSPIATAALIFETLQSGAARLQRSLTPPPPGFPRGPPGDAALDLLGDPLAFLERTAQQYGGIVGITLGGERALLVTDPAAAKTVLIDAPDVYVKEGTAFFPGSSLAGNGLLVSDGALWRRQRQLANPAFRRAAVERYASAMVECTTETLLKRARWRPGAIRDVYADFNELTLRITLTALFGAGNLNSSDAKLVIDSIKLAFEYFSRRGASALVIPESFPTPDNIQFNAAVAQLDEAVYGLIARRRAELAAMNSTSNGGISPGVLGNNIPAASSADLLTALLMARDEGGTGMDDLSLRDELMTLLVAGQETSAILLGWACAFLAGNPRVQTAAVEEVASVLNGRAPEPKDAQGGTSLQYLEAAVLETMRVMPPAYLLGRCTAMDSTLGGYDVPAGTTILISPYVMHRDPEIWGSDSKIFRPERWLEPDLNGPAGVNSQEESKKKSKSLSMVALSGMGPNGAYLPFGAGQRVCIGAGFAMTEAVLVLAALLQRFELCPVPGSKKGAMPEAEPRITLRPKEVRIMLRARKKERKKSSVNAADDDSENKEGESESSTVHVSIAATELAMK